MACALCGTSTFPPMGDARSLIWLVLSAVRRYHTLELGRAEAELVQAGSKVFKDDTVATAVLDVIRTARNHVILVSPYNKFWDHLRDEIRLAVQRGVRVTAVYRDGEDTADMEWLGTVGATVYAVDKLHAKIFLNESLLLLTSMNLHESSSKNSHEIALRIDDGETNREIRDYVQNRLMRLGHKVHPKPLNTEKAAPVREVAGNEQPKPFTHKPDLRAPQTLMRKVLGALTQAVTPGRCIRCEQPIVYNPDRPLCDDCFKVWNRYQDPDYAEACCHRCGRKSETSYAKPLCRACYQAVK